MAKLKTMIMSNLISQCKSKGTDSHTLMGNMKDIPIAHMARIARPPTLSHEDHHFTPPSHRKSRNLSPGQRNYATRMDSASDTQIPVGQSALRMYSQHDHHDFTPQSLLATFPLPDYPEPAERKQRNSLTNVNISSKTSTKQCPCTPPPPAQPQWTVPSPPSLQTVITTTTTTIFKKTVPLSTNTAAPPRPLHPQLQHPHPITTTITRTLHHNTTTMSPPTSSSPSVCKPPPQSLYTRFRKDLSPMRLITQTPPSVSPSSSPSSSTTSPKDSRSHSHSTSPSDRAGRPCSGPLC